MSPEQYLFAMLASNRAFRCLGVEYSILGYSPDVVLKYGGTYVIIECKNMKHSPGKKQVENYLRNLQENGDRALGVLFTQREYKLYSLEDISPSCIANTKLLIEDVLGELHRRSLSFGTSHFLNIDRCGAVEPEPDSSD